MKSIHAYIGIVVTLLLTVMASRFAEPMFAFFHNSPEYELITVFFVITVLGLFTFIVHYLAERTFLPSFVLAIFYGIAAQGLLHPVVENELVLGAVVSLGATLILFQGGLEIPFRAFKKVVWKVLALSFLGLLITSIAFSYTLVGIGQVVGTPVPLMVAVLLGALLASTDPAAIIPILKKLRFKNRVTKDIIISESAITDVLGTILTLAFLSILVTGVALPSTIYEGYLYLVEAETMLALGREFLFGIIFGGLGYVLLEALLHLKRKQSKEVEADAAYFVCIPILVFTISIAFGGSGFLAAFVAGLLIMLTEHLHETERFFNNVIDGFLKPGIFLLLGALVDIPTLIEYAGIGISIALLFILVIRPLAVFISLGCFPLFKRNMSWRDLLFVSFVRETGAIPAVLLVTIVSLGLPGLDGLVAIGMWVILLTLIIQPPLTPLVATKLKVANPIGDDEVLDVSYLDQTVVLGTRGNSYLRRMPEVIDWAVSHSIKHIVLLACPEGRYTEEYAENLTKDAETGFADIVEKREAKDQKSDVDFKVIIRKGFLQKNIDVLSKEDQNISAIFVGRKMLDYNLKEVKQVKVPLFFLD